MSLLDCFIKELILAREFRTIEPNSIATVLAESFLVQIRTALAITSEHEVVIPTVGRLFVRELTPDFEPDRNLKKHLSDRVFLLQPYLAEIWTKNRDQEVPSFTQGKDFPYSGLHLLETVGAFFLRHEWEQDKTLRQLSVEKLEYALCLTIHDAICCGSGIELQSVGLFKDLSFIPDDVLKQTIEVRSFSADTLNRKVASS